MVVPSLLEKVKFPPSPLTKKRIKESFDLGMNDWNDSDDDLEPLN